MLRTCEEGRMLRTQAVLGGGEELVEHVGQRLGREAQARQQRSEQRRVAIQQQRILRRKGKRALQTPHQRPCAS